LDVRVRARGLDHMAPFGSSADACEYGTTGVMGWAQDHAIVCVVGAMLAWLAVLYAVFSSALTLV
jgi:hypothetical protein